MFSDAPSSEALEEAHVVLEEDAQILDAVAQHRDAVGPHAEGKPLVALRIKAAVAQHDWMNHARAQDRQPAGAPARGTTGAATDQAADVKRNRRLGEWVVARPEASRCGRPEHRSRKLVEETAQVSEGPALVDHQPLDLEELEAMAGIDRLITKAAARKKPADGWLRRGHDANLAGGRVRPQHVPVVGA